MPQYDSPSPCLRDLPLIAFSLRPTLLLGGQRRGLPVLALEVSLHAWGLRLRKSAAHSRTRTWPYCLLAFPHHGHPAPVDFGAQYPAYRYPCPTLQVRPYGRPRMARGQDDSLDLSCTTLSFATPSRFSPALSGLSPLSCPTCSAHIDIGRRSPAFPVTPPGVRVRTGRFGGLSYRPPVNLGIPSKSK